MTVTQNQGPSYSESDARLSALCAEVAALRNRRRSSAGFVEFRPGVFYHLFALAAVAMPAVIIGVSWGGIWALVVVVLGIAAQAYAPSLANRLRYWALIRRPNRRLESQIESLRAEIDRLKAGQQAEHPSTSVTA